MGDKINLPLAGKLWANVSCYPLSFSLEAFAYEKVYQILLHRLTGADEEAKIRLTEEGIQIGSWGFSDPVSDFYDRYIVGDYDTVFSELLKTYIPMYLEGEGTLLDFYDEEFQKIFEVSDIEGLEKVIDGAGVVKEHVHLDDAFYKAIDRLVDMFEDCFLERASGEAEMKAYAISSPMIGAFLEWSEVSRCTSREDYRMVATAKNHLERFLRGAFRWNYVHTGVTDSVWYCIAFLGELEAGYGEPVGLYTMDPVVLPEMWCLSDKIKRLDAKYGFLRKEVRDAA